MVARRRILLLKPCCLGDVLLATPLAAAITGAWPEASLDWAVDDHSRPALVGNPHVDSLIDASHVIRGDLSASALAGLAMRLRRLRYDSVFVPDRSPILSLLARLTGARQRIGLSAGWRGFGYNVSVRLPAQTRHEAEIYLDLARAMGIDVAHARTVFRPSPADREEARGLLASLDAGHSDRGPLVAIHPGGGVNPGMTLLEKRWPGERFAALAKELVASHQARVILLGGPGDRPLAAAIFAAASHRSIFDLSGRCSLGGFAALVECCGLFIGNDSGVSHLAAAVGTPSLVIFGPTDPLRYGPLGTAGRAIAPATGTVSQLGRARGSTAIASVAVETVLTAALEMLYPSGG